VSGVLVSVGFVNTAGLSRRVDRRGRRGRCLLTLASVPIAATAAVARPALSPPTTPTPTLAAPDVKSPTTAGGAFSAIAWPLVGEQADFTWAGAYLGANLGAAIPLHPGDRLQAIYARRRPLFDLFPDQRTRSGVTVGAQAGYNWQIGRLVYGIETDFNLLDGQGGKSGVYPAPPSYAEQKITAYDLKYDQGANFFASLRGRLGFTLDRALIYATGGLALGGVRGPASMNFFGEATSRTYAARTSGSRQMKYILGAGVEYPLLPDTSARVEYLFLNQGPNAQVFTLGADDVFLSKAREERHILRVGLNHMFGAQNLVGAPAGGTGETRDAHQETEEIYSVHGVSTTAVQGSPGFRAAYSGRYSFTPKGQVRSGTISDVFMGVRLWEGASAFVNPEINQGYGPQNTVGAANYVNGSTTRVGTASPYLRLQRYFLRQNIGLGGARAVDGSETGAESEVLESEMAQIAGKVDRDRLTFTIGKMSVQDIFDDNIYTHDPTKDFLNYAFLTEGAFDYAANAWGYTDGAVAEWRQNWWTVRAGVYQLAQTPGSTKIEPEIFRQFMAVSELEARYDLLEQPGVLKFLFFSNNGYFSKFEDDIAYAFAANVFPPNAGSVRRRGQKNGFGVNLAQQLAQGVGFFLRGGMNDGRYQTLDYTDINASLAGGLVFDGELWGRTDDRIGVAAGASAISNSFSRYLQLGGLGSFVGDGSAVVGSLPRYYLPGEPGSPTGAGRLSYGRENVIETYYDYAVTDWLETTLDYQLLVNPGYNTKRGPVNFFGLRLRAEF
jgi:high affinity Mn2+ porin